MRAAALWQAEFKGWEKALMALATFLFLLAFYLYVTHYPLRSYLFDLPDEGVRKAIGEVGIRVGGLRRQFLGDVEFKSIDVHSPLHDEDTVVTDSDGAATLMLEDGSSIELAPSTMVRLRFESSVGFDGVSRLASVNVVAGTVTGEAKQNKMLIVADGKTMELNRSMPKKVLALAPAPPRRVIPVAAPAPKAPPVQITKFEILSPRGKPAFSVKKGEKLSQLPVSVEWKVDPPNRPMQVTLWKVEKGGGTQLRHTRLFQETVSDTQGLGKAQLILNEAGDFEWEIEPLPQKGVQAALSGQLAAAKAGFKVLPEIEGLQLLPPKIEVASKSSEDTPGQWPLKFAVSARWKAIPGAEKYRVVLKSSIRDSAALLERNVTEDQCTFSMARKDIGRIYYQVSALIAGGFVAHSKWSFFTLDLPAPAQVVPVNHAVISREKVSKSGKALLFTWQKTPSTEFYEVEVAKDPRFSQVVKKEQTSENFMALGALPEGVYYWRVRSSSEKTFSPPSKVYELKLVR